MLTFFLSFFLSPARAYEIETGTLLTIDTFGSSFRTPVSFETAFDEVPVVALILDRRGGDPATARILNISRGGFDIIVTEPQGNDGSHIAVNIHYIAMTPGVHRLPSGDIVAAGRHNTTSVQSGANVAGAENWDMVGFGTSLSSTASVIASIQTMNNEATVLPGGPSSPFLTVAMRGASNSSVQLALERSEAELGSVSVPETIGWIAFPGGETGSFTDDNGSTINWSADTTPTNIRGWSNGCFTNSFGLNSGQRVIVASKSTHNSDEGGWLRYCSLSSTTIGLRVDEDRDLDNERSHVNEAADFIVFSDSFHASFDDPQLTGRIFADNGADGGTPYNGLQEGGETGRASVPVRLFDAATDVLLGSTLTDANGDYRLTLGTNFADIELRLEVEASGGFQTITETPGALPSLNNPTNSDGQIIFTPAIFEDYANVNFGQIESPTLASDRNITISSGMSTRAVHAYTATISGDVSFSLANIVETVPGNFNQALYEDPNCSGTIDPGEELLLTPISVSAGEQACVQINIQTSTNITQGAVLTYDLVATTAYAGTTATTILTNTDRITVSGSQSLILIKQVCNASISTCDAATGANFSAENDGRPGDRLVYRLVFASKGPDGVTDIYINDATPSFTSLVGNSPTIVQSLNGPICALTSPAGGGANGYQGIISWQCTGGEMASGDQGIVSFDVTIDQ